MKLVIIIIEILDLLYFRKALITSKAIQIFYKIFSRYTVHIIHFKSI